MTDVGASPLPRCCKAAAARRARAAGCRPAGQPLARGFETTSVPSALHVLPGDPGELALTLALMAARRECQIR